jgi:predicted acetyltransferase
MKLKRERLDKDYGFIDYHYSISKKYPNGILVFMGSFIQSHLRGKGLFKEMVKELFKMFPNGTEVQVAVANKFLINFFKRMGFEETDRIEYWGKPENAINLKGFIL